MIPDKLPKFSEPQWVICQIKNGINGKLSGFVDPSLCAKLFVLDSFLHIILETSR